MKIKKQFLVKSLGPKTYEEFIQFASKGNPKNQDAFDKGYKLWRDGLKNTGTDVSNIPEKALQ